jgi:nicotinate-nucleotide adenylyltransferase
MTTLCFGGSFNPIHVGHLLVARTIAEAKGFERVVLIPSAQPPHKPGSADLAAPADRLAMCQLVSGTDPMFETDALELERSGPSYTLETALEFERRGWGAVHWLIGADMVQILPKWHRPVELLRHVTFWIAQRPGYVIDWDALPAEFHVLRSQVVVAPMLEISATEIRARVRAGRSLRYLVTPEVERYIFEHRLYVS